MYNLKLTIRNLLRQPSGTIINVIGLSLSIAVCLLIALFVQYEYSFEKHNPDADRIYRLLNIADGKPYPVNAIAFFQPLVDAIPELENGIMVQHQTEKFFQIDNEQWVLSNTIFSTNEFFSFFKINMLEGDPEPLSDVSSAAISRSLAEKLFPGTSAIGKTLRFEDRYDFQVRAIYEDAPVTSNHRPELIMNIHAFETIDPYQYTSMGNQSAYFYFLLPERADHEAIKTKVLDQAKTSYGYDARQGLQKEYTSTFDLQPLTDIHLHSSDTLWDLIKRSDAKIVQLFILVAVLLMLIAVFNFVNLSIALQNKRNFNAGMQKIMGAGKRNIFGYLLIETSLLIGVCLLAAIILASIALPHFNNLMDTGIALKLNNPLLWGTIVGIVLFSLCIPLVFQWRNLTRVTPSITLRGKGRTLPKKGNIPLAESLTIAQVAISICLVIGVVGINKQFNLLLHEKLGFNKSNLVMVVNPWDAKRASRYATYKQELEKLPVVAGVAGTWNPPGSNLNNGTTLEYEHGGEKVRKFSMRAPTDGDFFKVMQANFILGETYAATDSNKAVINEQCWQSMNVENPVGMRVTTLHDRKEYEICGVIEDIQNQSLQNESRPAIYYLLPDLWVFMVRLEPGDLQKSIGELEAVWNRIEPDKPFQHGFVDENLQANYTREIRTRELLTIMSLLAIFISMLGLYGLSLQIIQRRTKEIGIRKVNGATVAEILTLLNKRFVYWVLIAFIVAVPVVYYAMNEWLETFAYKTELSWWIFALGGVVVLLVALVTVSWQSWRSATRNPVEALRYE